MVDVIVQPLKGPVGDPFRLDDWELTAPPTRHLRHRKKLSRKRVSNVPGKFFDGEPRALGAQPITRRDADSRTVEESGASRVLLQHSANLHPAGKGFGNRTATVRKVTLLGAPRLKHSVFREPDLVVAFVPDEEDTRPSRGVSIVGHIDEDVVEDAKTQPVVENPLDLGHELWLPPAGSERRLNLSWSIHALFTLPSMTSGAAEVLL